MWRKLWNDSDWAIIICTFLLVCIGLAAIGSATHVNQEPIGFGSLVVKQLIFFLANAAVVIGMQFLNYHRLKDWGNIIYGITLLMLIAVMAVGTSALGAQRWIQLGLITIQPSEFSKLLMIICMAKMLEPRIGKLDTFKSLILPVLYVGVPIALVFLQPDLGTSLVYIAIFVGMLFISGIKTRLIKIIAGTGLLLMPLGWFVLKEYQKQRILVFLNPDIDPFGSGYHIIQSKIAIGSGLIFGKGIFNGTQSQLNFLPENHTDFIFSVIGEEFGFVGCIIVLLLLFMLIYRSIKVAYMCNDNFGMLLATGIATMFTFEVLVNVGMTIGIMPVTGIPLPFISQGGSSLITNLICVGLILSMSYQNNLHHEQEVEEHFRRSERY
ncbi:rod shape-determining protein RodA [Veillonella sp.]|uniref:rod shape-determining protein RodA n=1 Tax=Veillonella sp. TaxID=1926307 RepID=UPI0025ECE5A0|nr:rod shape-determining protein RodA [Veillonella sp.]